MITLKQGFMRGICALEVAVLVWLLCFGPQGARVLFNLQEKLKSITDLALNNQKELVALEHELAQWKSNTFFVEKYAREKLAMSRPDEIIGVVKKVAH